MSVHPPTSATHRPPPLVAAAETQSGAVLAFAYFISVRSTSYRPQDFPTLRLIFRPADERRPDRHVLAGFRGCEAARVPTAAAFPAPDDSFSMSGGFPAGPGRLGVSGPGQGGGRLAAVQLQPAPVRPGSPLRGGWRRSPRARCCRAWPGSPGRCPCGSGRRPRRRRSLWRWFRFSTAQWPRFRRRSSSGDAAPASSEVMRQTVSV